MWFTTFQALVDGIALGSVYSLSALGFSMIFGSTKIFHFAYGSIFTIAAYAYHSATTIFDLGWPAGTLIAIGVAIISNEAILLLIYEPMRRRGADLFVVFLGSLGIAIVIQSGLSIIFGTGHISLSSQLTRVQHIGMGLRASPLTAVALATLAIIHLTILWLLTRTLAGKIIRILSHDAKLLLILGINARPYFIMVFAIGAALATPAAILYLSSSGVTPAVGNKIMLISLTAAIIGGVGNITGTILVGFFLGISEVIFSTYIGAIWGEAVPFFLLIIFLMMMPLARIRT